MSINKLKKAVNYLNIIKTKKDISARDCATQWAEIDEKIHDITIELDSQRYEYISGGAPSENWTGLIDWITDSDQKALNSSLLNTDSQ